jgi:hypothetical protein
VLTQLGDRTIAFALADAQVGVVTHNDQG